MIIERLVLGANFTADVFIHPDSLDKDPTINTQRENGMFD